jgi:hypothetical protein
MKHAQGTLETSTFQSEILKGQDHFKNLGVRWKYNIKTVVLLSIS